MQETEVPQWRPGWSPSSGLGDIVSQDIVPRSWSSLQTLFTDFHCRNDQNIENCAQFASQFLTIVFYLWGLSGILGLSPLVHAWCRYYWEQKFHDPSPSQSRLETSETIWKRFTKCTKHPFIHRPILRPRLYNNSLQQWFLCHSFTFDLKIWQQKQHQRGHCIPVKGGLCSSVLDSLRWFAARIAVLLNTLPFGCTYPKCSNISTSTDSSNRFLRV